MIELIAGGARSGKSSYALMRAEATGKSKVFVATATVQNEDTSMAARVERHQQERDESWRLIEEPFDLGGVIEAATGSEVLVVDCLTLWLSNWLTGNRADQWPAARTALESSLKKASADVLLVTNEVGMGVVPMGQLSRDFVDQSGWLHQQIAAMADRVTLMMFGIPHTLKPA